MVVRDRILGLEQTYVRLQPFRGISLEERTAEVKAKASAIDLFPDSKTCLSLIFHIVFMRGLWHCFVPTSSPCSILTGPRRSCLDPSNLVCSGAPARKKAPAGVPARRFFFQLSTRRAVLRPFRLAASSLASSDAGESSWGCHEACRGEEQKERGERGGSCHAVPSRRSTRSGPCRRPASYLVN